MKLELIQTETKIYLFDKPLLFRVVNEGNSIVIEQDQLDLFASGNSLDEAQTELCNQFEYSYNLFNYLKYEQLSEAMLKVKQYYKFIIKQIIDK